MMMVWLLFHGDQDAVKWLVETATTFATWNDMTRLHSLRYPYMSNIKQEAQLPQKKHCNQLHTFLGWLSDRTIHRTLQMLDDLTS